MRKKILSFLVGVLCSTGWTCAQMEFSFTGITGTPTTSTLSDGSVLLKLPSGTDLHDFANLGMSATVDGVSVPLSSISPNPSTTWITDGEIETFVYNGKAYSFRFTEGEYFTAVIFSDPHIEHEGHDATTVADMQKYITNVVNMGKDGKARFTFDAIPTYVPTADIVFCLGDMDGDNEKSGENFKNAFKGLNDEGVPFITIVGNHDLVPDYWTGDNGDAGLTYGMGTSISWGGMNSNNLALKIVSDQWSTAVSNGIGEVKTINDGTGHVQANPFTFEFHGVRFYLGQTYWFQKTYTNPSLTKAAVYYAPDGVIDALDAFVTEDVAAQPSVWMQHYPFLYGSGCDRWWLDQNDVGRYIEPSNTTAYTTADQKKAKLASIINRTKNPVHFSGHVHDYGENTYAGIKDYSVAAPGKHAGAAFLVLVKEGVGVVEVKQVSFDY